VIQTGKPFSTVEEHQGARAIQNLCSSGQNTFGRSQWGHYRFAGNFLGHYGAAPAEEKIRRVNNLLAQNRKELRARNRQMQDDLKMARDVQLTMLPQQYPSFPCSGSGNSSAFQFTHRYLPTGTVGGDFFSISAVSETEAGVFICDVAGHGVRFRAGDRNDSGAGGRTQIVRA